MATDKILDLEVFDVDSSGVCTADGGFVGYYASYSGGSSENLDTNADFIKVSDGIYLYETQEATHGHHVTVYSIGTATIKIRNGADSAYIDTPLSAGKYLRMIKGDSGMLTYDSNQT